MRPTTTSNRRTLNEGDLHSDPLEQLKIWLRDATDAGMIEPTAMALATSAPDGKPSVRIVLLKSVEKSSLVFYTNYESRKGRELAKNPNAALMFYWDVLERQVRVEGAVTRTSQEESYEYFKTRPLMSRIGAWASQQSSVLRDREELEKRFRDFEKKFKGGEVPIPRSWGGFRLEPAIVEFWQGRESRLHDRLQYRREHERWIIERLSP